MSSLSFSPDPSHYDEQLERKQQALTGILSAFETPALEVFTSPALHYRQRTEFKIWHSDGTASYAMFPAGEKNQPILLQEFPVACENINRLMRPLMEAINGNPVLKRKLFQMEFLSTLAGQTLVTMVYHRQLDEGWKVAAQELQSTFNIFVMGRARKQKMILTQDFVEECFTLSDRHQQQRQFRYRQLEGCFSQPNAEVCVKMLNWACDAAADIDDRSSDLLELYCGNGNFTLPLSRYFDKVLATEISKPLTKAAAENCRTNGIDNIFFARLAAEEAAQALNREREFRRLNDIDLDSFRFSTVFVDPPRAGLDANTNRLVQGFDHILYISCNPHTLADNLTELAQTHRIERLALFDQFPYTEHMECGVLLKRNKAN